MRGHYQEGRAWLRLLLERPPGVEGAGGDRATESRALALGAAGLLAYSQGDYLSVRTTQEENLAIARELANEPMMAWALLFLGLVAYGEEDDASARSRLQESLALYREGGDKQHAAVVLKNLGLIAQVDGDFPSARAMNEESLTLDMELENAYGIGWSLKNLGLIAIAQQDYAEARRRLQESLAICAELGDKWGVAVSLAGLRRGDSEERPGYQACGRTDIAPRAEERRGRHREWERGPGEEAVRGVRILGASAALLDVVGAGLAPDDRPPYEQSVALARTQLSEKAFDSAWQQGQAMSMQEAVEYALEPRPEPPSAEGAGSILPGAC